MSEHPTLILARTWDEADRLQRMFDVKKVEVRVSGNDQGVIGRRFSSVLVLHPGHDLWVDKVVRPRVIPGGDIVYL